MSSVAELLKVCKIDWEARDPEDRLEELPSGEIIYFRGPSHRYWVLRDTGKVPLTSVTSILRVLDRPALVHWAWALGKQEIDYRDARDEASTRGTSIHAAAEALAKHGTVPDLEAVPADDRGYVQALASWWIDTDPEVIATEVIVASLEHGFSGRFDLLANIGGRRCLCDFKTGKRIFPVEMFAQLAGYELASTEAGHPPTDCQMIVRLGEDGTYEVAESLAGPADFLAIKSAFDAQKRLEKSYKELLAA